MILSILFALLLVYLFLWIRAFVHELGHLIVARHYKVPVVHLRVGGDLISFNAFGIYWRFGLSCASGSIGIPTTTIKREVYKWRRVFMAGIVAELLVCVPFLLLCLLFANSVFTIFAVAYMMVCTSILEGGRYKGQDIYVLNFLAKTKETELSIRDIL